MTGEKKVEVVLFATLSCHSGPVEVPEECSLLFSTEKAVYSESYENPTNSNDKKLMGIRWINK
jgi:hypothetical protein